MNMHGICDYRLCYLKMTKMSSSCKKTILLRERREKLLGGKVVWCCLSRYCGDSCKSVYIIIRSGGCLYTSMGASSLLNTVECLAPLDSVPMIQTTYSRTWV